MVYFANIALALEVVALVFAAALLLYSKKSEGFCRAFAATVGYFATVISLLAMLCTVYHAVRYPDFGMFRGYGGPGGMKGIMMQDKKCPMMEQMMKPSEDHEAHH